jgi:holdfast attachment protein HfaA
VSIRIVTTATALAAMAALGLSGAAAAQSLTGGGSASFNGGYARLNGQENQSVDFSLRNEDGNLVAVNGVLQPSGAGSVSQSSGSASASASAGIFSGGVGASANASAIGNNLTVVTQGNYNTVIVNSTQINNGNVSAGSNAGGGQ